MTNNKINDLSCNQSNDNNLSTNTNLMNTDLNNNNSQVNTASTNSQVSPRISSNYYYNQQSNNTFQQQNLIQNNDNVNQNSNQVTIKNEIIDRNLNINQSHQTNCISPINLAIPMNVINLNQQANLANLQHHNLQTTNPSVNQQTFNVSSTSQNRNTGSSKQRIIRTNLNSTLSNSLQSSSKLNTPTNVQPKTNLQTNLIHFQGDLTNNSVVIPNNLNPIQTSTATNFYDYPINQLNALQYSIFNTNQINNPLGSNQPNLAFLNQTIEPINLEEQEKLKLERKKLRNREAATKCRQKKVQYLKQLELNAEKLKTEVAELKTQLNKNEIRNKKLLDTLNEHIKNGCRIENIKLEDEEFED